MAQVSGAGTAGRQGRRRLADRRVSPRVAAALSGEVGPDLLAAVCDLVRSAGEPEGRLSPRDLVESLVAVSALIASCQGLQLLLVRDLDRALDPTAPHNTGAAAAAASAAAAAAGDQDHGGTVVTGPGPRRGPRPPGRRAADEIAPAVGMSPQTASRMTNLAIHAEDHLPAALDALCDGRISRRHLEVLVEVTRDLPAAATRQLETMAVRAAHRLTPQQLRTRLASQAAHLDPAYATTATGPGVDQRDVRLGPSPLPGCQRLLMDLPSLHALGIWHAVNGAARTATDTGTQDTSTREPDPGPAPRRPDHRHPDRPTPPRYPAHQRHRLLHHEQRDPGQARPRTCGSPPVRTCCATPRSTSWWPPRPCSGPVTYPPTWPGPDPWTPPAPATWPAPHPGAAWSPTHNWAP